MDIEPELLTKVKKDNVEFRRLYDEHTKLKNQVEELNRLKYLSPEQEVEKKTIQKQKLKSKERLMKLLDDYLARSN